MTNPDPRERSEVQRVVMFAINEGVRDAEKAIADHAEQVLSLYQQGLVVLLEAAAKTREHTEWSRSTGLTLEELLSVRRYLLSWSFISAWWGVTGNKKKQNNTALMAVRLVCGLGEGFAFRDVASQFAHYEEGWTSGIKTLPWVYRTGCAGAMMLAMLVLTVLLVV